MIDAYDIGFLDYWLIDESVNLNDAEAAVAALFPETLNEKQPPAAKRTLTAPPMNRIQLLPSDVIAARRETNARISAMLDNASRLADRINRYKDEQQYRLALKLQIKRIYALMSDAEYARRNVGRVEPQPLPLPPLDLSQVQTERD